MKLHHTLELRKVNLNFEKLVSDIITCVAVDRHGRKLATGSKDGSCLIWDISHKVGSKFKVQLKLSFNVPCAHKLFARWLWLLIL